MKYRMLAILACFLILIGLLPSGLSPAAARQPGQPDFDLARQIEFKAGDVLVKFKEGRVSAAIAEGIRNQHNAERVRFLYNSDVELWQVPEGQEQSIVEALNANPAVEYAELNYRIHIFGVPNDRRYSEQWAHPIVQSPAAWDLSTGSSSVTIAIVDSGIDESHPDLQARIVAGHDFVDDDTNPHDLNGHGTHCAGIAAAVTNNSIGVAGMDWQARIMPVRVIDKEGYGDVEALANGIRWASQEGADVISISLGLSAYSSTLQGAVNDAHAAGSLIVAAMGNNRLQNPTMYPAANDNVMAVAATTRYDTYAYYSQYGAHCDIAAPGGDMRYADEDGILSTLPTYDGFDLQTRYGCLKNYDYLQGTSMATPHVAGLAALVWSLNPNLTPNQVQATIQGTAEDLGDPGRDRDYGWGRIDAYRALLAHRPPALDAISNPDGDGTYILQWSEVPLASSYTLEEDDNGGFVSPIVRYIGLDREYTITGQGPGTWYYRVRAAGVGGTGEYSNVRSTTVKPNPPTLYAIVNPDQHDEYQISWSPTTAATSYLLEEDDNNTFSTPQTRYAGTSLSYNVTGQAGGPWYYRVRASNSGGTSDPSNVVSTIVAPPALDAPDLEPINNEDKDDSYSIEWSAVSGSVDYVLEQSASPYFDAPEPVYTGPLTQFPVIEQPGGTWHYRVRAIKSDSEKSPWSNAESAVVPVWIYLPFAAHALP
jgi:thermitase